MNTAIIGPARGGGTTALFLTVTDDPEVTYTCSRHTAIQHAVKVCEKLGIVKLDDVYIAGRRRTLTNPPKTDTPVFDPYKAASAAKHTGCDPYYLLVAKSKQARFRYTVPEVVVREIKPRGTLLIDEETTLDFFRPKSVELAKFTRFYTKGKLLKKKEFNSEIATLLENLPLQITKEFPDFDSWAKEVNCILAEAAIEWKREGKVGKEEVEEVVNSLPAPPYTNLPEEEKEEVVYTLKTKGWAINQYDSIDFFISALYYLGYLLHPTRTGYRVFLVADESQLILKNWLQAWQRIHVRVNTEDVAAWFYGSLGREWKVEKLSCPVLNTFILAKTNLQEWLEEWRKEKKKFSGRLPFIAVVPTKDAAEELRKEYVSMDIPAEVTTKDVSLGQLWEWYHMGYSLITYPGSIIERGIDLPFWDVVLVYDTVFACPYEEFLERTQGKKGLVERRRAKSLTQLAMRIAGIPGFKDRLPRFVLFDENTSVRVLPELKQRDVGKLPAAYLAELGGLICRKFGIKISQADKVKNRLGESVKFLGGSYSNIYYKITCEFYPPDRPNFLFLRALTHPNAKIAKSTLQNLLYPSDFEDLLSWLSQGQTEFATLREFQDRLRVYGQTDKRFRDAVLQKYLIKLLRETWALRRTLSGSWVFDLNAMEDFKAVAGDEWTPSLEEYMQMQNQDETLKKAMKFVKVND